MVRGAEGRVFVRDRGVVYGERVFIVKHVFYVDREMAGVALIQVGGVPGERDGIVRFFGDDRQPFAQAAGAAVQVVVAVVMFKRVSYAVQREAAASDAVGEPAYERAEIRVAVFEIRGEAVKADDHVHQELVRESLAQTIFCRLIQSQIFH